MPDGRPRRIHYDDRLRLCGDEQIGASIPVPLNRLVDELCAVAEGDGAAAVHRKEMVAAIIFHVIRQREDLAPAQLVDDYRNAFARDVLPDRGKAKREYYEYGAQRPGRKPRTAGASRPD